uniref:Uncharacterized protein n=1 Tax=Timema poppense TaxID=170557 RepID=A0A7R9D5U2_TIMPO|nr:unnamed protein product [Timema poppensis]
MRSYLNKEVADPVYKTEINGRRISCADHMTPSILKCWQYLRQHAEITRIMSAQVEQQPVKVGSTDDKNLHQGKGPPKEFDKPRRKSAIGTTGPFPKKNKHETDGRNFKFGRKRAQSFTTGNGKFFPPYKRRKKEGHIIPPTKFLLGGNIYDPLNLNSLQDEEINRLVFYYF